MIKILNLKKYFDSKKCIHLLDGIILYTQIPECFWNIMGNDIMGNESCHMDINSILLTGTLSFAKYICILTKHKRCCLI